MHFTDIQEILSQNRMPNKRFYFLISIRLKNAKLGSQNPDSRTALLVKSETYACISQLLADLCLFKLRR